MIKSLHMSETGIIKRLVVIANFFEKPCAFPDIDIEGMQVLLHNYEAIDGKQLRAYEAMILFKG